MRRHLHLLFAAAALVTAACSDGQLSMDGATAPAIEPLQPRFSLVPPPAQCPTVLAQSQTTVDTLLPQIFGPGQGRRGKAQGLSNNIVQARRNGNQQVEEAYVDSLINFTLANYYGGTLIGGQSQATQIKVLHFFYALYCASGITPIPDLSDIFSAENTRLIRFSTPTTTVSAESAAVRVEQGDVPSTIFGTWVSVFRAADPLPTSLDWYGVDGYRAGAWEFVSNPVVEFTDPVLTGVCIEFDDAIVSAQDLRLAHAVEVGYTPAPGNFVVTTAGGTIEISGYADPTPLGLACDPLPAPTASRGAFGRLLRHFAALIVPERAYALPSGGSTGGTVRKFSPFGAVDIKLNATGSGPSSPQSIPIGSSSIARPVSVTVTTRIGAVPIDGIAVSFAPPASFLPASAATSATGTAGSSWTIVAGSNTATATASAPQPLTFTAPVSFSVTAVQLTAVAISTTSPLPAATVGTPYSHSLLATGGDGSYVWSQTGGTLPAGLALSAAGVVAGTPTASGMSTFTVQVASAGGTATRTFDLTVNHPTALGPLVFQPAPSGSQCYALNVIMAPHVGVKVTSTSGQPLAGVPVAIVAVTNNGSKVAVSQPSATTGINGVAVFSTLSINKTGAYRLIASTAAPWPVKSVQSAKFNISPSCP